MHSIRVIDSHTEGEPTRMVVEGGPDLGTKSLTACVQELRGHLDHFRTSVVLEPRGNEVIVGGLLLPPRDPTCDVAVIFFNNAGYLGMCGHGTIGLVRTLSHLREIPSRLRVETPVGVVVAIQRADGLIAIENVESWRFRNGVEVRLADGSRIKGDVAYGGNWFFIAETDRVIDLANARTLTDHAAEIMKSLAEQEITGERSAPIDHVELWTSNSTANARNFVLCPGGAYDRSPCGTGTSAKLACLAADGSLRPGETWIQESVIGTRFEASFEHASENRIRPTIAGRAFLTGETTLLFEAGDPLAAGINSAP